MNYVERLNSLFGDLKIKAKVISCDFEGTYLIFDIKLQGGKCRQIEKHATEIALSLKAVAEPLIYPITHMGIVRIELMTLLPETVLWRDIEDKPVKLPLILGRLRNGDDLVPDLKEMPHLLIGGATGSGKSIMLHSIINGLLQRDNVRFALIDTKRVEFSFYSKISRLYAPIAQDIYAAIDLLNALIDEMEYRFVLLKKAGSRDISTYPKNMSYIVVVIDELADLMLADKRTIQDLVCRLAQKSRACGIHMVVATQRPSADVITGLIKANFPARIGCKTSSAIDSRVLLGQNGAEKLLGKGDAIIDSPQTGFKRFKGAYLSELDIVSLVSKHKNWWRKLWSGAKTTQSNLGNIRTQ